MALHDLLDRLVVDRTAQPDAFRRVYLHEGYLRAWLYDRPRWRLLTGDSSYRVQRLPCAALPERGLPRLRAPIDYACLCWVLWFAEVRAADPRRWFVISELAGEVARVAGSGFSLGERGHREALVRSLQLLVDLGALVHRDGQAERWVLGEAELGGEIGQPAEVLYEFAEDAPRLLAGFDAAGLRALAAQPDGGPALPRTGEETPPVARAWRALLLGPVLWQGDDPEAFGALRAAEDAFARDLEESLGWGLEVAEDFARVWRTTAARGATGSVLLDLLPDAGDGAPDRHLRYIFHPVFLLLGALRAELEAGRLQAPFDGAGGALPVSEGLLHDLFVDQFRRYRRNWGADLGEQAGAEAVWERVRRQMRQMGFLRGPDELGRAWLLPVAARLAGAYAEPPRTGDLNPLVAAGPAPAARTLFDRPEGAEWDG